MSVLLYVPCICCVNVRSYQCCLQCWKLSVYLPSVSRLWSFRNNLHVYYILVTFRVRRSRSEMYIGHDRLWVCLSLTTFLHYCMDLDVTWGNGRGCHLVVHYWAYLQSVHAVACISLLRQHSAKCEMSAGACMSGCIMYRTITVVICSQWSIVILGYLFYLLSFFLPDTLKALCHGCHCV